MDGEKRELVKHIIIFGGYNQRTYTKNGKRIRATNMQISMEICFSILLTFSTRNPPAQRGPKTTSWWSRKFNWKTVVCDTSIKYSSVLPGTGLFVCLPHFIFEGGGTSFQLLCAFFLLMFLIKLDSKLNFLPEAIGGREENSYAQYKNSGGLRRASYKSLDNEL